MSKALKGDEVEDLPGAVDLDRCRIVVARIAC